MTTAQSTSVPTVGGVDAATINLQQPAATPSGGTGPYQTRTRWRPWPAFGMVVLITVVSMAIALVGSLLVMRATGTTASESIKDGKPLLAMFAAQLVMIFGAILAAGAKGDDLVTALALKAPAGGIRTYIRAMAFMLGAVALYTAVTYFVLSHAPSDDLGEIVGLFRGSWWLLALIVIGIGAPLSEELLFRGFLQSALVPSRLGYWGASIVTTVVWTALHAGYSVTGLVEVFMIGMVFALFLRLTGSLRVTMVCHGIYNSGIALLLIFAPKELLGF